MAIAKTFSGALLTASLLVGGAWIALSGDTAAPASAQSPAVPTSPKAYNPVIGTPSFRTANMFTDTFRSTHIARGVIVGVTYPDNDVKLTFRPTEYIHGAPLAETEIQLVAGTNADLRGQVGKDAVAAWIVRDDGVMGLTHGLNSITPSDWDVDASVEFYRDILMASMEGGEAVKIAADAHPADSRYNFPAFVTLAYKDALIRALSKTGTHAAWQAGQELATNPTFYELLDLNDYRQIGVAARGSMDGAADRGYSLILLRMGDAPELTVSDAVAMIKTEHRAINLDHLAYYLYETQNPDTVVTALTNILLSPAGGNVNGIDDRVRANAMKVAAQFGSRKILPTLHRLLGHEVNPTAKRELLDALWFLRDASNFKPLLNYINGGDATKLRDVHADNMQSTLLHKMTLSAIAVINSEDSNSFIQQAYDRTRVVELKHHLRPLLQQNAPWREMAKPATKEGDMSFEELDRRYRAIGIIEERASTRE